MKVYPYDDSWRAKQQEAILGRARERHPKLCENARRDVPFLQQRKIISSTVIKEEVIENV